MGDRKYVGDGVFVEFDAGFPGNTVLVTSDGRHDSNRIELEPEVWAALMVLMDAHYAQKPAVQSSTTEITTRAALADAIGMPPNPGKDPMWGVRLRDEKEKP